MEKIKGELVKYYSAVVNEGKTEYESKINEEEIKKMKDSLTTSIVSKTQDKIQESLEYFRIAGLRLAPELRVDYVYQLITQDVLNLKGETGKEMINDFLEGKEFESSRKIIPLISLICSTSQGIDYIKEFQNMRIIVQILNV